MVHFHLTFNIFVCFFIHELLFIEHYRKQHKEDERVVFKQEQPPKDELFYYEQEFKDYIRKFKRTLFLE